MELELKHIALYGIGTKAIDTLHGNVEVEILGIDAIKGVHVGTLENGYWILPSWLKLILRPLSDLINSRAFNDFREEANLLGEDSINVVYALVGIIKGDLTYSIGDLPHRVVQALIRNHFDVFKLIPQGLAVDSTTLK